MSGDGNFIAGTRNISPGEAQAFRWSSAGGIEFLTLPLVGFTQVTAISDDGSVVVGSREPFQGPRVAYRWTETGGYQDIGSLNGEPTICHDVSGDGRVILGQSSATFDGGGQFTWDATGGFVDRDADFEDGIMRALSFDGSVAVGGTFPSFPYLPTAFAEVTGITEVGADDPIATDAIATSNDGSTVLCWRFTQSNGFALISRDPLGQLFCDQAVPNSTGCVGRISAVGSTAVSSNSLRLEVSQIPASTFGFFLASSQADEVFQPIGSVGVLCLGGAIGRFVGPGQVQNSGPAGSFGLDLNLAGLPQPNGPVAGSPGETWRFQAWHRDTRFVTTSNFTEAIAITLR